MTIRRLRSSRGSGCCIATTPSEAADGENPLALDSRAPSRKVQDYLLQQTRFKMLTKSKPEDAKRLWARRTTRCGNRYRMYEYMASRERRKPRLTEG